MLWKKSDKIHKILSDERYYIFVSNYGVFFRLNKKNKKYMAFERIKNEIDNGYEKIQNKR